MRLVQGQLRRVVEVIPRPMEELSGDYATEANKRVLRAMLKMGKIDIAALERAYADEA